MYKTSKSLHFPRCRINTETITIFPYSRFFSGFSDFHPPFNSLENEKQNISYLTFYIIFGFQYASWLQVIFICYCIVCPTFYIIVKEERLKFFKSATFFTITFLLTNLFPRLFLHWPKFYLIFTWKLWENFSKSFSISNLFKNLFVYFFENFL